MSEPKHPMQPIVFDDREVARFKKNAIVEHLLDNGGIDLNQLACIDFPQEDREQFAQLIGYSVSGFGDLGYVTDDTYAAAVHASEEEIDPRDARIAVLESKLEAVRIHAKNLTINLFRVHSDDLRP